jgi:adenylate cyclase class IV
VRLPRAERKIGSAMSVPKKTIEAIRQLYRRYTGSEISLEEVEELGEYVTCEVALRTWRDQMRVKHRLDQILEPHPLPHELCSPGDLDLKQARRWRSSTRRPRRALKKGVWA